MILLLRDVFEMKLKPKPCDLWCAAQIRETKWLKQQLAVAGSELKYLELLHESLQGKVEIFISLCSAQALWYGTDWEGSLVWSLFPWEQGCSGLERDMPCIFQLGSLAAAWADPWLWRVRERRRRLRSEGKGEAVFCVSVMRRGGLVQSTGCGTPLGQDSSWSAVFYPRHWVWVWKKNSLK